MKKTYLLIEVTRFASNNLEDVHGVSDDIDTLKEVAVEENNGKPLMWNNAAMSIVPIATRTTSKTPRSQFEIIEVNNYNL